VFLISCVYTSASLSYVRTITSVALQFIDATRVFIYVFFFSEVSSLIIVFVVFNAFLMLEPLNKFVIFLMAGLQYVQVAPLIVLVVGFVLCGF